MPFFPAKETPEHQTYKILEHWQPKNEVLLVEELTEKKSNSLFSQLYKKAKSEYKHFPLRKNGKNPFTHPLNVVWGLRKAQIDDQITLCAGLLHDLIEEKVDEFKLKKNIKKTPESIKQLDEYEQELCKQLEKEIEKLCKKDQLNVKSAKELMQLLEMLTRHKRHFYYRSISAIFNCPNEALKEKAIQIKLADRIHNIQSVECFNEEERIFQCFKNLFILNNTKKFLQQKYEKDNDPNKNAHPTEKLFKKCSKATYDAFWSVCRTSTQKGKIVEVESMLHLAFKKFTWEKGGLWAITEINANENHPMHLFQGIIKKYDARLHQEWDKFEQLKDKEKEYCHNFFMDYNFSNEQLDAILEYKDAYALKEVVAKLLYDSEYVIDGFACSKLCTRNMKCMRG